MKNEISITSVKKHENFSKNVDLANQEFTGQKTLQLINKGFNIKQIAETRNIKEGTVWNHIENLVKHHQLPLKRVMKIWKIANILRVINSKDDKLKEIRERINDEDISYNEIAVVLANIKGKNEKKSITYYLSWYQKTNCLRKCYYNKKQRNICRVKFQQLIAKLPNLTFTKKEFLHFFNNEVNICVLSKEEKIKFVNYNEFKLIKSRNLKLTNSRK